MPKTDGNLSADKALAMQREDQSSVLSTHASQAGREAAFNSTARKADAGDPQTSCFSRLVRPVVLGSTERPCLSE